MNLDHLIKSLREELEQVTAAIRALEALRATEARSDRISPSFSEFQPKKRGRPLGSKNKRRDSEEETRAKQSVGPYQQ